MSVAQKRSRRKRGASPSTAAPEAVIRPPWSLAETGESPSEQAFLSVCSACGKCREECPEEILEPDDQERPVVDFRRGGCTFCGACVKACQKGALSFDLMRSGFPGWQRVAVIGADCLRPQGEPCQACIEACPQTALHLSSLQDDAPPTLLARACTACGYCIGACPQQTITLMRRTGTGSP